MPENFVIVNEKHLRFFMIVPIMGRLWSEAQALDAQPFDS